MNRRLVLGGIAASVVAAAVAPVGSAGAVESDVPPSIDEQLEQLPPDIADRLRKQFHAMIDAILRSETPKETAAAYVAEYTAVGVFDVVGWQE